jgi:protease secretion system outer membrane protein
MPLYSGGGVAASVDQAQADLARAEADLRSQRETVEVDVQRYHQAVTAGAAKIDAYRQAVASAELAVLGAERALEAGVGTTTAVLEAEAQLYTSRRDFAQTRYDYLLARLRLFAQAGVPADELVADIDRLLTLDAGPPRPYAP